MKNFAHSELFTNLFKIKRLLISLSMSFGLILCLVPNAHADVLSFPCGKNGATYSVNMPAGVLTDGVGCSGTVTLDSSVKSIGSNAFKFSNMESVIIPNSVLTIDNYAFAGSQLTSVTFGNSLTSIGSGAFLGDNLTSVTIPNSVTYIGVVAFSQTMLTSVTIPNSVITIDDQAFLETPITSITIGNSVTSIGQGAFKNTALTSVTIPNSVTNIGSLAFSNIPSLATISIPDGLKTLGASVFDKDNSLASILYCGKLTGFPIATTCPPERQAVIDAKAASDKAAASAKTTTITCIKGKLSKKVTAIKPSCPAGYKKK